MTTNIVITKSNLDAINMKQYTYGIEWSPTFQYYDKDAGKEFYRLLVYLVQNLKSGDIVVDIGTYYGLSAVALASNNNIHVITYDIYDNITDVPGIITLKNVKNIEYRIKDCCDDIHILRDAKIIVLDVDPHDGIQEIDILEKIRESAFRGIVICDDIHLNSGMKTFWDNIPERKIDASEYGHWSGTGVIFFSDDINITFS